MNNKSHSVVHNSPHLLKEDTAACLHLKTHSQCWKAQESHHPWRGILGPDYQFTMVTKRGQQPSLFHKVPDDLSTEAAPTSAIIQPNRDIFLFSFISQPKIWVAIKWHVMVKDTFYHRFRSLVHVYTQERALRRAKLHFRHTFREYWLLNLYEIFDLWFLNKMNQIDVQLQSKSILLSQIVYHNVSSE